MKVQAKEVIRVNGKAVNARKYDLAFRLAKHLLTLPSGGWPETQQAIRQLEDQLPKNISMREILAAAKDSGCPMHPNRKD